MGAALAMPAYAAEKADKKGPASVDEGAPDKTGKAAKGAAGVATMPAKGPSSANEGAPEKTGKDATASAKSDSKKMANPKTPSSVNEGAPDKTGKGADKVEKSGAKKADTKY
jgi:hypothetical protein